ncbi:MAG: hypothetical protein ACR2MG_13660 [Pyrinomonadaceae bacterium]
MSHRFSNVQAGETYIISVSSKSYIFLSQVITLNDNLDNLEFSPVSSGIELGH